MEFGRLHQAEAPSPVIADGSEASRPVEDAAFHPSQDMFKEMSDQHYRMVRELKEQKQLDDEPHTWTGDETQTSCWALLEDVPVPGGIPESGDETRLEEAGAKQSSQCLDTHEARPLVDTSHRRGHHVRPHPEGKTVSNCPHPDHA